MEYTELIQQCLSGNRKAQRTLFDLFAPKMLFVCRRYAVDMTESEDMLQEGFVRLFANLDKFRNTGPFEGWVHRIFVNSAIKYYRRTRKHNGAYEIDKASLSEAIEPDAIESLSENELLNLLSGLPRGYRLVFNLYAIEGYSHREIAELLEIEESTSRSQLLKARKLLQLKVHEIQKVIT